MEGDVQAIKCLLNAVLTEKVFLFLMNMHDDKASSEQQNKIRSQKQWSYVGYTVSSLRSRSDWQLRPVFLVFYFCNKGSFSN